MKDADIRSQAQTFLSGLYGQRNSLANTKASAVGEVVTKYSEHIGGLPLLPSDPLHYFPDATDGFARPYFEIMDKLTSVDGWMTTDLPAAIQRIQTDVQGRPARRHGRRKHHPRHDPPAYRQPSGQGPVAG